MGVAVETISATSPATATITTVPFSADPTQSLNIRAANGTPCGFIFAGWGQFGGAADATIHSNRMHDPVAALKWRQPGTIATPAFGEGIWQPVYSQDVLTVAATFASAPDAVENLGVSIYYPDLPGTAANLASKAQVMAQTRQNWTPNGGYLGVRVSPITSATAGNFGAGVSLTSTENNFKANSWYALLGWTSYQVCSTLAIQGTDIGNVKMGGPGAVDPLVTRMWFCRTSDWTGLPMIPIINSANAGSTLVFASDTAGSTTVPVDLLFAYLGPSAAGLPI